MRQGGEGVNIDLVFQIAGLAIIVSVLHTLLKQAGKEEYAWLITLVGIVLVLGIVVRVISDFFTAVRAMFHLY